MAIETNCFRINGLDALSTTYRLYQVAGLRSDGPDYYGNLQRLVRQLSFDLRAPVTTHHVGNEVFLGIPTDSVGPPEHVLLVGVVAVMKDTGDVIDLDFTEAHPEYNPVRLRFLQFILQGVLWQDSRLWQPGAGEPFFYKSPVKQLGEIDLYEGFSIRATLHPEGGFGLVIDLRRKLVSRSPLTMRSRREQINALKGRSCVYKMGNNWFEVTLDGLSDVRIGTPSIPLDGEAVSLIDYLNRKARKPVPRSIANLSPDGAAIYYRTTGPEQRSAPAALCYLVEDTHSRDGARTQHETVIKSCERHRQIHRIIGRFLSRVPVGHVALSVSDQAGRTKKQPFSVPTLQFGNGRELSLEKNEPDLGNALREYGRSRLMMLKEKDAGFFEQSPLGRQYLVLPKSVDNSYGSQFTKDLIRQVDTLYPDGGGYNPEVIVYDDLNSRRDFVGQARAIKMAVGNTQLNPGYALVMIHRYDRRPRSADQLAAWAVKEFPELFGLKAAVIHSDMAKESYTSATHKDGTQYFVKSHARKRLFGYLRNVVLNKVLLTNGKWPFVLKTSMHADVVIGIDVKSNTAAFALIADGGKIVRFSMSSSRQKEQLLKAQIREYVTDIIRREGHYFHRLPKRIVIHRDGRTWPVEIEGLKEACRILASEGRIDKDWQLSVIEINKTAPAPLRLFDVKSSRSERGIDVENPFVGNWIQTSEDEGYICTTGRPFPIPGTSKPLHIRRVAGEMFIEHCLADVFSLSCLTWTRPEGATRLPISIKLCDRILFDEAAEYDHDALEFANVHLQEETAS